MSAAETRLLYLDANVFIDALEAEQAVAGPAQRLLVAIAQGRFRACTSELTLAEVLVRPEREGRSDLKQSFLDILTDRGIVALQPVSRTILIESARYRAAHHPQMPDPTQTRRNFLPDAIHVVTALEAGATVFVGRDNRLRLPAGVAAVCQDEDGVDHLLQGAS